MTRVHHRLNLRGDSMKHSSHYLPLAPHPIEDLWSARPSWADRAIGAAAAAVFVAGIVSAGLVDSGGPAAPTLAAPAAAAPSGGNAVRSVDQIFLPPATSSNGTQGNSHAGGTKAAVGGSIGDVARSVGSAPVPPGSTPPGSNPPPATPPTADPPAAHGPDAPPVVPALPTLPVPGDGVTVGPVTVDATPADGTSVTVSSGVIAPITVGLP